MNASLLRQSELQPILHFTLATPSRIWLQIRHAAPLPSVSIQSVPLQPPQSSESLSTDFTRLIINVSIQMQLISSHLRKIWSSSIQSCCETASVPHFRDLNWEVKQREHKQRHWQKLLEGAGAVSQVLLSASHRKEKKGAQGNEAGAYSEAV